MRFDDLDVHVPHLVQQHSVGFYKTTLSTMLVFDFEIIHEFKLFLKEKSRQFIRVWQALQTRVHVAGVAQVLQSNFAIFWVIYLFYRQIVQLIICLRGAFILMETFVFLHALLIAVADPITPAGAFEDIFLVTPFTLAELMTLLLHVPQVEHTDLS